MSKSILFFMLPLFGHVVPNQELIIELMNKGYRVICVGNLEHMKFLQKQGIECMDYGKEVTTAFQIKENINTKNFYSSLCTYDALENNIVGAGNFCEYIVKKFEKYVVELSPQIICYDTNAIWGLALAKKYNIVSFGIEVATNWMEINHSYVKFYKEVIEKEIEYEELRGTSIRNEDRLCWENYFQYYSILKQKLLRRLKNISHIDMDKEFKPDYLFSYETEKFRSSYSNTLGVICCGYDCDVTLKYSEKNKIYITRGTCINSYSENILLQITKGLKISDSIVVSAGNISTYKYIIRKLCNQIDNVAISPFVNQLNILQQSKLMISHGGITGVREAIISETPMIIYPVNIHEYNVGTAVERLGIGIMLKDRSLSYGNLNELNKSIDTILSTDFYKINLKKTKLEFQRDYKEKNVLRKIEFLFK